MTATLDILDRLVGFDTVSARSNLELIDYVTDFLAARGFRVTRLPDPTGHKAGLFAALGPPGPGLLLSGHSDVVPVEGQDWTSDPFRLTRRGGRVTGRGTTDMKGFVACMLAAADRATGRALRAPLQLALSYDEEVGCLGIRHMIGGLEAAIGRPRACIVGEPTSMRVATGHKGKVALRATCLGEAGHSALAPRFVNALDLAADFVAALRAEQRHLVAHGARDDAYDVPHSTVHAGILRGGTALNIVPDRAEVIFEIRFLAADGSDAPLARLRAAAEAVAARYRATFPAARIGIEVTNAYPGLDTPPDAPVVALAAGLAGTAAGLKVAYGTEAGFFAGLGIPTVVCGPGSMQDQGHKADESVGLDDLAACDAMLDRVLDTLCA